MTKKRSYPKKRGRKPKEKTKLSDLKKGDLFTFKGKKKVYEFNGGGPIKGYSYTDYSDISNSPTTRNGERLIEEL